MSEQLRNKIQQWEANPPQNAWTNIALALQEVNAENQLSLRFRHHEEIPPPEIWTAVLEQIHPKEKQQKQPAPVIPFQPLYPFLLRYGAVAILAGLVAWIFIGNPFWENGQQNNSANFSNQASDKTTDKTVPRPSITTAIAGNPSLNSVKEQPKENTVSKELPAREPRYAVVQSAIYPAKTPTTLFSVSTVSKAPVLSLQELPVQKRDQRYITIYSESGEPVRLSAKFAPLYHDMYHSFEKNDPGLAKGLLQKMQDQMTRYPFIPDPYNHFDMIRLVDLLQQEQ